MHSQPPKSPLSGRLSKLDETWNLLTNVYLFLQFTLILGNRNGWPAPYIALIPTRGAPIKYQFSNIDIGSMLVLLVFGDK